MRSGVLPRVLFALVAISSMSASAQNRGTYPLGMSALNSGVTPPPGITLSTQLLYYSRDEARDDSGNVLPVSGHNAVLMNLNTLGWTRDRKLAGDTSFSASATIPLARNNLTSDLGGDISGGSGLADSYFLPAIFGWSRDRYSVRAMYGFLAPTGRYSPGATDNVGSGYWTHAFSSGQTWYLTEDRRYALSAFQMYEIHTTQEGTGTRPGETLSLDMSVMRRILTSDGVSLQAGIVGYLQRQTTATTGPNISEQASTDRYAINAGGLALSASFPEHRASLGLKLFKEFSNRSTYQGYSLQMSGSIGL